MTPTATYIAEENCLQEISQMADPGTCPNELDGIEKCDACKNLAVSYAAHLATLRKIPCSPEPGFKDGEKYTEGVDYEIKGAGDWKWCYQLKGNIFAAPIVPVKSEGQPGEIEKLRAENSKMRKALEGLTEENNKLAAENHTQSEELGELKNITDGLDGRIINQQRDLLVAYRNKIALMPGITIETILAMLEDDIKTLRTMDGAEIVKNIIDPLNNKS